MNKGKFAKRSDILKVKRYMEKNLLNLKMEQVFEKCSDVIEFFEHALHLLTRLDISAFKNQKEFCHWLIQVNVLQSFLHGKITNVYGQLDEDSRAKIKKHFRLDATLQTIFQVHLCNYLKATEHSPVMEKVMEGFVFELPKDIHFFETRILALEHNAFKTPSAQKPRANRFHYRCITWFYALIILEQVRRAECCNEFNPAFFELPLHRVQLFANLSRNKDLMTSMIMFVVWAGKKYRKFSDI